MNSKASSNAFSDAGGRGHERDASVQASRVRAGARAHARAQQRRRQPIRSVSRDGAIAADNTDGVGLVRDLTANLGCALRGARILLLGAGGAAYGVCGPLLDEKPVAPRDCKPHRREGTRAVRAFQACARERTRSRRASYPELETQAFDVVINATSAGLAGEMPALSPRVFASGALAYDMTYGRAHALSGICVARTAPGPPTASACWSNRQPSRSSSGAACGRKPRR